MTSHRGCGVYLVISRNARASGSVKSWVTGRSRVPADLSFVYDVKQTILKLRETLTMATQLATLGGGCFWCLEAVFEQLRGVQKVVSGYCGGDVPNATYEEVCGGRTGHAEVVQVTFDPAEISFADLLDVFFATHDPTTLNRQGADAGTQYRSAIFCHDDEQQRIATAKIAELDAAKIWDAPIVTQVAPLKTFYAAEDYHQGYFRAHPAQGYCQAVISPKVAKFRQKFAHRLRG